MGSGFRGVVDASVADIPDIVRFEIDVFREHREHHPQDFQDSVNGAVLTKAYRQRIRSDDQGAGVYVAEGTTIGYVAWTIYSHYGTRQALIHSIVVHPEHRGMGAGRALLSHAETRAIEEGAKCLRANIWAHNKVSRAFFATNAFGPVSEIVGRPISGGLGE